MTKNPSKPKSMRNIYRRDVEHSNTHCWEFLIRRNYQLQRKFFSDNVYGSKKAALQAAKTYRDEYLKENATKLSKQKVWRCNLKRRNNTSGIVGVCRFISAHKTPYWVAQWADINGTTHRRQFSVKRYGEEEAKELAWCLRKNAMKDLKQNLEEKLKT